MFQSAKAVKSWYLEVHTVWKTRVGSPHIIAKCDNRGRVDTTNLKIWSLLRAYRLGGLNVLDTRCVQLACVCLRVTRSPSFPCGERSALLSPCYSVTPPSTSPSFFAAKGGRDFVRGRACDHGPLHERCFELRVEFEHCCSGSLHL